MRSLGVELLRYVPDDAFIARFKNVSPQTVQALSYIRFVGAYRPDHKVHPELVAAVSAMVQTNASGSVPVNILLSPTASEKEIGEVHNLLTRTHNESRLRQGVVLRGTVSAAQLNALAKHDGVLWIERARPHRLVDEVASKIVGGDDGRFGTPTLTQQLGFNGTNVVVAIADTGLDSGNTNNMHPDIRGRVGALIYYGTNITSAADEHSHGTHVAGIVAGDAATGEVDSSGALYGLGVASGATLMAQRIFDAAGNEAEPFPSDAQLARDAVQHGAKIGSNSWGTDVQGAYDIDAAAFDELVRDADSSAPGDQPYILEFSAGNAGPDTQTLDSPATGKNVIATGASENNSDIGAQFGLYGDGPDTMADFSSRGPCEDGRIKPDLVAPGTWIASLLSSSASSQFAWLPIDNYYIYMGGTSQAGPHASGAAAVFVQYYKSQHTNAVPSPALVKAALINSADELDVNNGGPGPVPNNDEGWGRINLANIIGSPRAYQYLDQTVLLTNTQVYTQHVFVQDANQPLKITLAYTDVPGFPGALPALVNDLDLEVVGPDGTLYLGNQFDGEDSEANPPAPDNLNNVEGVHLSQPLPGDYQVRVRARNLVLDARLDTQAIDQDFALVVSGDLTPAGTGAILLDRTAYTAPGVIKIEVLDAARAASNTVTVLLKSTTESAGENYILHALGNYGAFTGSVATVVGNAAVDGKLEIHSGDLIQAFYTDASSTSRVVTAAADVSPPVLTGVAASLDLGVMTITWQTTEPGNSIVHYSTNLAFNLVVTNATLTTNHVVKLTGLVPGLTYHYYVSSSDAAGNSGTNNNSGADFSFVAVRTPVVLLVDAYEPDDSSPTIPDGSYTNALAATGLSWSFWKVTDRGSPQLIDLQPYQAVIWRVTDSINYGVDPTDPSTYGETNNTLSAGQQTMIQNYLNGGGAFFMASMNILSQIGNVPFRKNVLQVGGFKANDNPYFPCSDCDEQHGVEAIQGADGTPITAGINVALDYSQYPSIDLGDGDVLGPDFSDVFTPNTNALPLLFETTSGRPCGVGYPRPGQDSPGRVVFFGFPLDTIPEAGSTPNNETAILQNVLNFLVPGANGVGRVALDSAVYTLPSQVTVELGDSDLAGTGQTHVTFASTTVTNKLTVTLSETPHLGLFRGHLTLVATNPPPGANQLRAANGATITATYFDASSSSNVAATALVDTVPPVIANVTAVANYSDATVSWITSKPADSLVQFGESPLLGRTAYVPILATNHSVSFSGLLANHTYYYEVVSRDDAGNTATDDNHDNLYTFHTLKAPSPPWFDNLESGAPGWTVAEDPDVGATDVNWELGTPNNSLQVSAHSGVNAWGMDLKGESVSLVAGGLLYSPPIDLSGLGTATLTFWDSFDFSSMFEEGEVLVMTNSSTPVDSLPVVLDLSTMSSPDWEQETADLTPFVGSVVQLIWRYEGASLGTTINGWLVDDVGITGTGAGSASQITIAVSKNIAQGTFSLTGPVSQSGQGLSLTVSNAPPGQYVVHYDGVPFYQAPPDQTNTAAIGDSVLFRGNYTFADLNNNGISDAWEQFYFGSVSTNRTQTTDTDHDGMTDYAEFIAGTNPTNAASKLSFISTTIQTNGAVKFQWAAVPGRAYEVLTSTNLTTWTPVTDWILATGSPMSYTNTNVSRGGHLFRVQVHE